VHRIIGALGGNRAADAFRKTVSGDPSGAPLWSQQMAVGDDVGLFGPDSAVWEVHGSISTLVGGIRALLMQAAHPAALTGVAEHSQYDTDPLGRLERTTRWLTITSFGSTEAIAREAQRVNEIHKRVSGDFQDKSGHQANILQPIRVICSGYIAHLLIHSFVPTKNLDMTRRFRRPIHSRMGEERSTSGSF
jgi:hypothetical protein